MSNKAAEQREHQNRKSRFNSAFTNAAQILEDYSDSVLLKNFPKDDRSAELRDQFFMACALKDSDNLKQRLARKIRDHIKGTPNAHIYTKDYLSGAAHPHIGRLVP